MQKATRTIHTLLFSIFVFVTSSFAKADQYFFRIHGHNGVVISDGITVSGAPSSVATSGVPYAAQFTASGGTEPYRFTTSSVLPPGLALTDAGVLSGTPANAGTYSNIVVEAIDALGMTAVSGSFSITVNSLTSPVDTVTTLSVTVPSTSTGISYIATINVTPVSGNGSANGTATIYLDGQIHNQVPIVNGTIPDRGGEEGGVPFGTYDIFVTFTPSDSSQLNPSTSNAVNVAVLPIPTITLLTSLPNPSAFGNYAGFIATVIPGDGNEDNLARGTVTFYDGDATIGQATVSVDSTAVAVFAAPSLSLGTHNIYAQYGGSAIYSQSASSPVTQNVLDDSIPPFDFIQSCTASIPSSQGPALAACFSSYETLD